MSRRLVWSGRARSSLFASARLDTPEYEQYTAAVKINGAFKSLNKLDLANGGCHGGACRCSSKKRSTRLQASRKTWPRWK